MLMHHVLTILSLTFIQGRHTDLNQHENKQCLIISQTIEAMPITFAVKIVRLKVYNYNLFSVREDLAPLKVTTASET